MKNNKNWALPELSWSSQGKSAQRNFGTAQFFIVIFFLLWHTAAMATISVQVTPQKVQLGEEFRLTLSSDGSQAGGIPNLTPLQENFNIIGTERSMFYSVTNGQTNSVHRWTVLLTAKKKGMLVIPGILIGHQQSAPSSIEVTSDAPTQSNDTPQSEAPDEVMLKSEVSTTEPFVNQQVIYTVKLYNSQRLLDAQYEPPSVEDAIMVPLGNGLSSQTTINGHPYTVEEQRYAIFPQKSGPLDIHPATFNALVFETMPRRIKVRDNSSTLNVKPIPAGYSGKSWVPSNKVALTEVYDQSNVTMKQGATLTRTITLQAAGIPAQLLPVLKIANGSQFNVYSEKPTLQNIAKKSELIGRYDIKMTYLLNKPGQITIPEVHLPWFNLDTGKKEIASLPARTIEIQAINSVDSNQSKLNPPAMKLTPQPIQTVATTLRLEKRAGLAWWLVGILALAWIVTLLLWGLQKGMFVRRQSKHKALKTLKKACASNDPYKAQLALREWAQWQWPNAQGMSVLPLEKWVQDIAFKKQLAILSHALYSQEKNIQWQGDALWGCIKTYLHKGNPTKNTSSRLPPINPG